MKLFRILAFGAVAATAFLVTRNLILDTGRGQPMPALDPSTDNDFEHAREPVLGYDGMDADSLLDWLMEADLDEDTLRDIADYERAHFNRGVVLEAVNTMLG